MNNIARNGKEKTPAQQMRERELPNDMLFLPFGVVGNGKLTGNYVRKLESRCVKGRYLHMCMRTGAKLIELIHRKGRSYRENIRIVRRFQSKYKGDKDRRGNKYKIISEV